MLTHRNLVANILQSTAQQPVTADDTLVGVLPFFHIYGLIVVMNAVLRNGATLVTMPRFDLEGFLALVEEHRVTKAHLVPPIVLALAKSPLVERFDLSSLTLRQLGRRAAERRAAARPPRAHRLPGGAGLRHDRVEPGHPRHAARPRASPARLDRPAGAQHRVPDRRLSPAARSWAPGEEGEMCVRGPQVMRGYLDDPEATAATVDADGWLHTGDIGRADDDGYVVLVDRVKELIKYKGYQVAPAELEAVLVEHPAVADAAVIGRPDEEAGEVPKAFVALCRRGDRGGDHGLRRRARGALQEAARARVRRRDPQVAVGQDPAPRAQGARVVGSAAMPWQVYLSGEIHTDWRERIVDGADAAGLDVEFTGPVTDHAASDDCGVAILGAQERARSGTTTSAPGVNAIRTRTLLERADVVVVRFGEQYRQWNAAFDAGYAAALGKALVTLHPPEHDHALKEVDRAALAVAREPEQVVDDPALRGRGDAGRALGAAPADPAADQEADEQRAADGDRRRVLARAGRHLLRAAARRVAACGAARWPSISLAPSRAPGP